MNSGIENNDAGPPGAAAKRQRSPLMSFLNSALGIWLLTTISVSVLTPALTYAYKAYEQHAARAEQINRLRIEIAGRLLQFQTGIKPLIEDREAGFKARPEEGRQWLRSLILSLRRSPGQVAEIQIVEIFPGFKSRNLLSLIIELGRSMPEEERTEVGEVWDFVADLRYLDRAGPDFDPDEFFDRLDTILKLPLLSEAI